MYFTDIVVVLGYIEESPRYHLRCKLLSEAKDRPLGFTHVVISLNALRIDLGLIPLGNVRYPPIDQIWEIVKKQKASISSLQTMLQNRVESIQAGVQISDDPVRQQAEKSRPILSDESLKQPLLHLASAFEALMSKAATWDQEMQDMLQGDATIATAMIQAPVFDELSS
ncbi:MAG: hypothetical protein LQ350_005164 [Teloschistes chrysophthalmus]|nr:MAG: hypothetical protein LQ350_005164 [Niorma chrysophthalma]